MTTPGLPASIVPGEPGVFLNRDGQVRFISQHLEELRENKLHFRVLEVFGDGGMGKTTLLKQMRSVAEEDAPPRRARWVPLFGEQVSGQTAPLQAIRDTFAFECPLFNTALLVYWSATAPQFDRVTSSSLAQSLPVQALQAGSGLAGFPLPFGFAAKVFEYGKAELAEALHCHRQELELIDALRDTPEELEKLLPEYLAVDIARAIGPKDELLFLYDGYEKQEDQTREDKAPWLRKFIATMGCGLHLITSRERLLWDEQEWAGVVELIEVDPLPEAASRELIQARLGELGDHIEDHLLEASQMIPFYLETVIGDYSLQARSGEVELDQLPTSLADSVPRLIEHLSRDRKKLAVALATVQVFDKTLFRHLVDELGLQLDIFEFESFVGRYFVEDLPDGLYKIHDIVTEFIRRPGLYEDVKAEALRQATQSLYERALAGGLDEAEILLALLRTLFDGWYSIESAPVAGIERLVDACYLLYDAGYWSEVGSMPLGAKDRRDEAVSVVAEFFAALSRRRLENVPRALESFGALDGRTSVLGRHRRSVDLEAAYLRELDGEYSSARVALRALEEGVDRFDPTNRLHIRSRLYLADMQSMDGELRSGSRLLLETSSELDRSASVEWAELTRHRGHAFRFSFMPDQAARNYRAAMQEVEAAPALCGKLQTNLAEAYCWLDPHRALKEADLSIELNSRFANRIELAKCDAARGIALSKLGQFDPAGAVIDTALASATDVGYPAGQAFALQAEAIRVGLQGDDMALASAIAALRRAVASLDTYSHLLVAPLLLSGDAVAFGETAALYEWIEPEGLEARLGGYLLP